MPSYALPQSMIFSLIAHADPLLLEITIHMLEENVDRILATQRKILNNQDMIFQRLRDLKQKYRTINETAVSRQSVSANYSHPNSLFPTTAPSPEWYKGTDDEDLSLPHQSHPQVPLQPQTPQIQPTISLQPPATPQSHLPMHQPQPAQLQPPPTTQPIQTPVSPLGLVTAPTLPLPLKRKAVVLESAAINKSTLQPVESVMEKYRKLKTVGSAGTLAVKLAKESFFGEEVLARCTVYGAREQPGLPIEELN